MCELFLARKPRSETRFSVYGVVDEPSLSIHFLDDPPGAVVTI